MTLDPILTAPPQVQAHIALALVAILTGPLALFRRSRDRIHRTAGMIWVAAMAGLAATGLMIETHMALAIGPFGPIHLLSLLVFWNLARGILFLARGQARAHGETMRGLYIQALIFAGILTFLPGRTFNRAFLGDSPEGGYLLIAAAVLLIIWASRSRKRRLTRPVA